MRMYDLGAQGAATQVAAHDAPVKCVRYIDEMGGMIVTAGWDKKLRVSMHECCRCRSLANASIGICGSRIQLPSCN